MPPVSVSAIQLQDMLRDGEELAVLDLRDEGLHTNGHLLLAASLPLSRLELDAHWRLPRRTTRMVLVDESPLNIKSAAGMLAQAGYTNVFALDGFHRDCEAAGLGIFSGKYVPSKAFGEVVETTKHTPRLDAASVLALQQQTHQPIMVDSRTEQEFHQFALPGAVSCPGAELVGRVAAVATHKDTVLVNCAGRTRSIIGAQSLINAGIAAPVYAVENGTMGWHLQGLELARGQTATLEPTDNQDSLAWSREAALGLLARTGGRLVDWQELQALRHDANTTTYFYDVRLPKDYQRGTFPGARNASGGELVQSTDYFAPVRHAHIVVADMDLVQAPMTAHWLRQMGWQADVLDPATAPAAQIPAADSPASWLTAPTPVPAVDVQWLNNALHTDRGLVVIDCASSIDYRRGHIPGARFCTRSALADGLAPLRGQSSTVIFTAYDEALAQFAAADALAAGLQALRLAGGTTAWRASGLPLEQGPTHMLSPSTDIWYSPYEVEPQHQEQAMHDYITWETGLTQRIAGEPGVYFNVL